MNVVKYTSSAICFFGILLFVSEHSFAQLTSKRPAYTRQDSLRGSINPERAWWDVASYNIYVEPDYASKTIKGYNQIYFDINTEGAGKKMQIDLQQPMQIDSIVFNGKQISNLKRDGNIFIVDFGNFKFNVARTF